MSSIDTSSLASILVIEDNKDVRALIRRYLTSSFQIVEVEDGEIGINVV